VTRDVARAALAAPRLLGPPRASDLLLAALRGREQDARDLIDANAKDFASRGEGMGVTVTRWASAVLDNGLAR
jgi:hypothetical protein